MNKIIILISIFFMLNFSFAQEMWDWNKCIEYALQNNIQLKLSDVNKDLANIELRKNKFNYTPTINAQSNYNFRIGKNYNFFQNEYVNQLVHYQDYNLNIQQNIFDGLLTKNQIAKSKLDIKALELDNEALKTNLQMQILTAYLNILNAKEQLAQSITQQKSTLEQKARTEAMIEAGAMPESNLFDIEAQLASEEANIILAKNQHEIALLTLKNLLQLDLSKQIDVVVPEISQALEIGNISNAASIFAHAVTTRPEVLAHDYKIQSAKKNIKIAKANNFPTLNFLGNINTFYTNQNSTSTQSYTGNLTPIGFVEGTLQKVLIPETKYIQTKTKYFPQLKNFLNYSFGLGLNIPIYNKNTVRFAVQQAEKQIVISELNKAQTIFDLNNNIHQAYIKTITSEENYIAAKNAFEATQKSFNVAEERVKAGLSTQLELNLAKNTLINTQSRLTQSKYEYLFNKKLLDFYQGIDITLK
jgi:outer membrane protein